MTTILIGVSLAILFAVSNNLAFKNGHDEGYRAGLEDANRSCEYIYSVVFHDVREKGKEHVHSDVCFPRFISVEAEHMKEATEKIQEYVKKTGITFSSYSVTLEKKE